MINPNPTPESSFFNRDNIESMIDEIAGHTDNLTLETAQAYFQALNHTSSPPSPLEVLYGLNKIELIAIEKGSSEKFKTELDKIHNLCQEIIKSHPIKDERVQDLLPEVLLLIQSNLSNKELGKISTVSKDWEKGASNAQIQVINTNQVPLDQIFKNESAKQVVEWLVKNPSKRQLEYADFSFFSDFDNECLEILTKNCPNLKHLNISGTAIRGDALNHLEHTKKLQSLDISLCRRLAGDSLKYLVHTKELQSLGINGCIQLDSDSLKHLEHTKKLRDLNIGNCIQLHSDSLKHLDIKLRSLNIVNCTQLDPDSLKHLDIKELQILNIGGCTQLDPDSLKYLEHAKKLLEHAKKFRDLHIGDCTQLDHDSLKHLDMKELRSLNINECTQLDSDSLKYLEHAKELQSLDISHCTQLDSDSLKYLEHTKKLQRLNMNSCNQLDSDSLKHLEHTKKLQRLEIIYCEQLDRKYIPNGVNVTEDD